MKRLIVNADDFGFTRGVNQGIVRAFKEGIVTSATIMANGNAFEDAARLARDNPELSVGCHLALVGGLPLAPPSEISSLVDANGALPPSLTHLAIRLSFGRVRREHVEREFEAQIERVLQAGITPSHLDTHKHSHSQPLVFEALARVAEKCGITRVRNPFDSITGMRLAVVPPNRRRDYLKQYILSRAVTLRAGRFKRVMSLHGLRTPRHFCGAVLTGLLDRSALELILRSVTETTELMCHPGVYDGELERARTRLKQARQVELEALSDPKLIDIANEQGVALISYREL